MKNKKNRIATLESFVLAWEVFDASIPEEFGDEVWARMKNIVQMARCELNCLSALDKRDS